MINNILCGGIAPQIQEGLGARGRVVLRFQDRFDSARIPSLHTANQEAQKGGQWIDAT